MKKQYIMPKAEEIELKMTSMLCLSGGLGGDAEEPALAPDMDNFVNDLEDY